jgi:hypothetical protein
MERIQALQSSEYFVPACVYAAFSLLTWLFLLRHGRASVTRRGLQVVAAVAWPLYWPLIHGPIGSIRKLVRLVILVWVLGAIVYPFYFLYRDSEPCNWSLCADRFLKSVVVGSVWPLKLRSTSASHPDAEMPAINASQSVTR